MLFPDRGFGLGYHPRPDYRNVGQNIVSGGTVAQGYTDCPPPPGFTWLNGMFVPLLPGVAPTNGICGWSPISFPGTGMKLGPFVFPWTPDTMPQGNVGTPNPIFSDLIPGLAPPNGLCVGEHSEYNGVNGKTCSVWTSVVHDWKQLPVELMPHLQKILLSDVEGNGHGFGNFWNNKTWLSPANGGTTQGQAITLNTYQEWATALGISPDQNYYLNFLPVEQNNLGYAEHWYEGLPIAQFDHPKDKNRWGIWLALESTGGYDTPLVLRIVVASLAYAKSQLPGESTFHQILDALNPLNWPGMLVEAIFWAVNEIAGGFASLMGDLVDAAGNLICDLATNPTIVNATVMGAAATQGIPPQASQGIAQQISSMAAQKCGNQPPNCKDPKNAKLTQCQPAKPIIAPTKPWWQQWYVIVPAVAVVGYFLIKPSKGG
jgi:hypothetical protein